MASDSVFLATRNSSIPAACRTFALTGDAKVSANAVRTHLLRLWELVVRVLNDADTAELWATAMVVRGAASLSSSRSQRADTTAVPLPESLLLPSFPAIDGTLLTVYTAGDQSVIDLADPASAAAFFMSLGRPACGREVVVRGLSLPPRPITLSGRRCPRCLQATAANNLGGLFRCILPAPRHRPPRPSSAGATHRPDAPRTHPPSSGGTGVEGTDGVGGGDFWAVGTRREYSQYSLMCHSLGEHALKVNGPWSLRTTISRNLGLKEGATFVAHPCHENA